MTSTPLPIILLKTRSHPTDNYDAHLSAPSASGRTFSPTFIPVLKHTTDPSPAASWIADPTAPVPVNPSLHPLPLSSSNNDTDTNTIPPPAPYGGLIFTSQRAVEAFAFALTSSPDSRVRGLAIPLYVVGPATSAAVAAVAAAHLPHCPVLGAEAGNGAELAKLILGTYERGESGKGESEQATEGGSHDNAQRRRPLLFFVGEQRRDIIPRTLMSPDLPASEQVQVDERVLYRTEEEEGFEGAFRDVMTGLIGKSSFTGDGDGSGPPVWTVVFSPTGCAAMLRVLGWDAVARVYVTGSLGQMGRVRVASIGPTTRDYLRDHFGFEVDVCAERPSPEGVRDGIERFMKSEA